MSEGIIIHAEPRRSVTWDEFLGQTPRFSIALDGYVRGPPQFDEASLHANFDHHTGVVREATMSTAKQVYFAMKGGLFQTFQNNGKPHAHVYVNDSDQDTAFALWLLQNPAMIEGTNSIPTINRLLALTDELDITAGAFPRRLDEKLMRQHAWVFEPYTNLRKSGGIAAATPEVLSDNLEATTARISQFMMGKAGERALDTRHEILYESPFGYKIINEIGGNEARYVLFANGLNAGISLVATRGDGRKVWAAFRRSRFIPLPLPELVDVYNAAEGLTRENGWGGSDIVIGSSRELGSGLDHKQLGEITDMYMGQRENDIRA